MATFARIFGIDELGGERCIACGAAGEDYVDLETPEGVARLRMEDTRRARVCRSCAQAQDDATHIGSRLIYGVVAFAPVTGIVAGVLAGRSDGIAGTLGVLAGLVGARAMIGLIKAARAKKTRVLLLEAEGERLVLQLTIPEPADSADTVVGGYRVAAREEASAEERVSPLPPRTSFGLQWFGGLLVCVAVIATAWSGAFTADTTLVIDSPRDAVQVSIDYQSVELAAGGVATRTVSAGVHTYTVRYLESGHFVSGSFDVSVGRGTLLTTDPAQCYRVWTASSSTKTPVHENETVRWANLQDVKMASRTECRTR